MICHAEILETIEPIVSLEVSMKRSRRRLAENGKSYMCSLINNNHKVEEHHPCNAMRHGTFVGNCLIKNTSSCKYLLIY